MTSVWWADPKKDRQMWLYIQTWLPILSISLTAAICFGVASFVMGQKNLVLATFEFGSEPS